MAKSATIMTREEARESIDRSRKRKRRKPLSPGKPRTEKLKPPGRRPKLKSKQQFASCPMPGWVLKDLVSFYTMTSISRVYGVHTEDVRHWCWTYDIKIPCRGYWASKIVRTRRAKTRILTRKLVAGITRGCIVSDVVLISERPPIETKAHETSYEQDKLLEFLEASPVPLSACILGRMLGFQIAERVVKVTRLLDPLVDAKMVVRAKGDGQWLLGYTCAKEVRDETDCND